VEFLADNAVMLVRKHYVVLVPRVLGLFDKKFEAVDKHSGAHELLVRVPALVAFVQHLNSA